MATDRKRAAEVLRRPALWTSVIIAACLLLSACGRRSNSRDLSDSFSLAELVSRSSSVTLTDFEAGQEYTADMVTELSSVQAVQQSFIARRGRLNSIQVWLQPVSSQEKESTLTISLLRVMHGAEAEAAAQASYQYSTLRNHFPLTVRFPTLDSTPEQRYILQLATDGGPIRIMGRAEDVYPDGDLRVGQALISGDMAFRLTYSYDLAAFLEDLPIALRYAWLVLPALLALWLPGRVVLLALEKKVVLPFDWGERSALAIGLSLALFPSLMVWTTALGLHWSQSMLWVVIAGLGGIYLLGIIKNRKTGRVKADPAQVATNIALAVIFLGSLAVRFIMVRDLATPAWVDSVHHAIITHLVMDQGAIPATYAPLVDSSAAAYHPGFHISLAIFTWLSGLPLHSAMLVYGQILNALAVLCVYLFTKTLTNNRLAGLLAGLITGMVSPMPAYYASWGRYTQLAGLLILPCAAALLVFLRKEQPAGSWRDWLKASITRHKTLFLVTGLALGGLYLTHYRVAGFLVMLAVVELLVQNLFRVVERFRQPRRVPAVETSQKNRSAMDLMTSLAAGLLGLALTGAWWPAALQALILPRAGTTGGGGELFTDFSWHYLTAGAGVEMLWLAGAGLVLALLLNWRAALTLVLWVSSLFTLANLRSYGLPGGNLINNTSVEIALFLPLSVLGGYGLARIIEAPQRWLRGKIIILYAILWIMIGIWTSTSAAQRLLPLLNPTTILSRQDDLVAIRWIEENVPPGETILINPFRWGYGLYAGNDGGYWITPLAGRPTLPPSVLVGLGSSDQAYRQARVNTRQVTEAASDPQALHSLMDSLDIKYLYIGKRGGLFSPQTLLDSQLFEVVYQSRGTWVIQRR